MEIFPLCDIGKGTLGDTFIRKGAKLSFQVHIAHNCDIGPNSILAAGSRVAGSSILKGNCFVGNGAIVRDKVVIGKNARVGAGAVVLGNISDNVTAWGNPAREVYKHVEKFDFDKESD